MIELIGLYLRDTPLHMAALREAMAEGNLPSLQQAAHTLKGSSGNLGVRQMTILSDELERKSRDGSLEKVEALLTVIDST
ncbi:MAG: Hpt domain-containing protein [Pyrinomonadaceae bacterium]|nr:Hpt domain-containing protein [Pyrinomonadaceae bacterium]